MTDICVTIKDILYDAAVANFPGDTSLIPANTWQIEIGKLPESPDQVIAIMNSTGKAPNPKWAIDYPSVQAIIRGKSNNGYTDAKSKAQDIKDVLLGLPSGEVNGDIIVAVNMIGDIASMGFDTSDRPLFSVNFSLIVEPAISELSNRTAL